MAQRKRKQKPRASKEAGDVRSAPAEPIATIEDGLTVPTVVRDNPQLAAPVPTGEAHQLPLFTQIPVYTEP